MDSPEKLVGHHYMQANIYNVNEILNIESNVEIKTKTRIHDGYNIILID